MKGNSSNDVVILGVSRSEYDRKDGVHISGYNVHVQELKPIHASRGSGYAVRTLWLSDEAFDNSDPIELGLEMHVEVVSRGNYSFIEGLSTITK